MLPPEINSARMYDGPGSGPMLAAAAAWDELAGELYYAAASYQSVISMLTGEAWSGPSSASMAAAAAAYVGWMNNTAELAEQTASQAKAAAAAYETALAATVPPPVIAANRALLMALVATNFFGQNTPAIMAVETQYAQMWAQDATAMHGYADSSASATTLTPFTQPAPNTNPAGLAEQAAAVAQAGGTSTATNAQTALAHLTSAVPTALPGLPSPVQSTSAATSSTSALTGMLQSLGISPAGLAGSPVETGLSATGLATASGAWVSADQASRAILATQGQILDMERLEGLIPNQFGQAGTVGSAGLGTPGGPTVVSAGLGRAELAGRLSVPHGWAAAAIRPIAAALSGTSLGTAAIEAGSSGSLFGEMALASMAGRAIGATASMGRRERDVVNPHVRAMLPHTPPGGHARGLAAELREFAQLRDSGILTDEEFTEQKRRLLAR